MTQTEYTSFLRLVDYKYDISRNCLERFLRVDSIEKILDWFTGTHKRLCGGDWIYRLKTYYREESPYSVYIRKHRLWDIVTLRATVHRNIFHLQQNTVSERFAVKISFNAKAEVILMVIQKEKCQEYDL